MNELIAISKNGKATARGLYEFLELTKGQFARWANQHILNNQFAEDGIDFERFDIVVEGNETIDFYLSIDFAKKLCMVSKSERGEQARNYFIEVEKRYQQQSLPQMTQTQLIAAIANIQVEQEQKLIELQSRTENVERRLTLVKDTIVRRDENWRQSINEMLNKIAKHSANNYQEIRAESYRLLEERANCDLNTRLRNLRKRLEDSGSTKTKINTTNRLDVIENDSRLKEIYSAIVKEMTIKYVA